MTQPMHPVYPSAILTIRNGKKELLTILSNGEVKGSIEDASEAGKLFIESIRLNGSSLIQKIKILEEQIKNGGDGDKNKFCESVTKVILFSIRDSIKEDKIDEVRNNIFSNLLVLLGEENDDMNKFMVNLMHELENDWQTPRFTLGISTFNELIKIIADRRMWMNNSGKLLNISDMATKHLVNSLKCLDGSGKSIIECYNDEQKNMFRQLIKEELKLRK